MSADVAVTSRLGKHQNISLFLIPKEDNPPPPVFVRKEKVKVVPVLY
jgi:hypothetical protein